MVVKIDKSFQKDTNRILDQKLLSRIANCILNTRKISTPDQITNIKKLKGSPNHYRIKIGDYRLGVIISGSEIEFIRCLHRRDIYKFFPKK